MVHCWWFQDQIVSNCFGVPVRQQLPKEFIWIGVLPLGDVRTTGGPQRF